MFIGSKDDKYIGGGGRLTLSRSTSNKSVEVDIAF